MKPTTTEEAFNRLVTLQGQSAALDYVNKIIAARLAADYPNLEDMPASESEHLWAKYLDMYTGSRAEELLPELTELLEELEAED